METIAYEDGKGSKRSSLWGIIRGSFRGKDLDAEVGNQQGGVYLNYGMVEVSPGIFSLNEKNLRVCYEALEKDSATGSGSSLSSSSISKYSSCLRAASSGFTKCKDNFMVFSFGFNVKRRSLPELGTFFSQERLLDQKCEHSISGVLSSYECFNDARKAVQWKASQTNGKVLILGSADVHTKVLLAAASILNKGSLDREASIGEGSLVLQKLISGESLSVKSSGRSFFRLSLFRKKANPETKEQPSLGANENSQSSWKGESLQPSGLAKSSKSSCFSDVALARTMTGVSELCSIVNSDSTCSQASELFWRKMILRKIVLSHVPRVDYGSSGTTGNSTGKCRPYIMLMNGDQTDFLYSTMVQGIREFEYSTSTDVAFDINCRVAKDVVIKLYHLEPEKPGSLLLKAHVNVSSAEPVEDPAIYKQHSDGEQMVLITVPAQGIEHYVKTSAFEPSFNIQLVFGMPAESRALSPFYPKCFPSEAAMVPTNGPDSQTSVLERTPRNSVAGALEMTNAHFPPMQFKCQNPSCAKVQYLPQASEATNTKAFCKVCKACTTLSPAVSSLVSTLRNTAATVEVAEEVDEEKSLDFESQPLNGSESILPAPAPPPAPAMDSQEEHSRESQNAAEDAGPSERQGQSFDIEAFIQDRIDGVFSILSFHGISRQQIERRLRLQLASCSNEEEAHQVLDRYVNLALERDSPPQSIERDSSLQRDPLYFFERRHTNAEQFEFLLSLGVLDLADTLVAFPRSMRSSSGLGLTEIARLPVHVYTQSTAQKSCSVCLLDFEEGDELRTLPCFHAYHVSCIDPWLVGNRKCPVCQQDAQDVGEH